jgi:hypothetical protein
VSDNQSNNYGEFYWYVRVTKDVSENGELTVMADYAKVEDGVLIFIQKKDGEEKINMVIAPGKWLNAFFTYKTS